MKKNIQTMLFASALIAGGYLLSTYQPQMTNLAQGISLVSTVMNGVYKRLFR